jgi:prepilin-type N-terminal cleavage/methylation domain-containing protein
MIIKNNSNRGFTLIELLLSVALISIIILPLTLTLTTGYKNFYILDENIEVMQHGRVAMDRIVDNIRHSSPNLISIDSQGKTALVVDEKTYYLKDNGQLIEEINGVENDIAWYVEEFNLTPEYKEDTNELVRGR